MKPVKRIFVVDGDSNNWNIIASAFKQIECPHRLHYFADATSLLDHISIVQILPDLILLDNSLHQLDGLQFLKTIKLDSQLKIIPVIMWCSQVSNQDIIEFYQHGANSVVEKLLDWDSLLNQVELLCTYWLETVHLPKTSLLDTYS